LKVRARSTNCSTESSGVASDVNAAILRTPSNRTSGPTSTRTEPGQAPAVPAGPGQRVDATERHPDEHEPLELQRVDKGLEIGGVTLGRVVHLG